MVGVLVIAGTLVGCASSPPGGGVQVVDRNQRDRVTSGQYIVRRGDTLWSIAFRFGWDWRDLARVNGIQPQHVIYPGQRIRLSGGATRTAAATPPDRTRCVSGKDVAATVDLHGRGILKTKTTKIH